jgi:hypothetical protein
VPVKTGEKVRETIKRYNAPGPSSTSLAIRNSCAKAAPSPT